MPVGLSSLKISAAANITESSSNVAKTGRKNLEVSKPGGWGTSVISFVTVSQSSITKGNGAELSPTEIKQKSTPVHLPLFTFEIVFPSGHKSQIDRFNPTSPI